MKALARAFRWRRLLEEGQYASLGELAAVEKVDRSQLARLLRLTLLASYIVEAILDGRQSDRLVLRAFMDPCPLEWSAQRQALELGRVST